MMTEGVASTYGEDSLRAARDHARAVVEASGTSFFWAMRLLPEERRDGMFAVYAFCREVDDIADEPAPLDDKRRRLDGWRDEIDRLYAGRPGYPTGIALLGPLARYGLRKADFLALIDGMEMDAREPLRIADMDELLLYCDRVACAVGRLSNRVFGIDDARGDPVAEHLGLALQLTNILRDLKEDAALGRLYLPADRLAAHGIGGGDPRGVLTHPALPDLCREIAKLAEARFVAAEAALARCEKRIMRPALAMKEVYHRILERLVARDWRVLEPRVGLSKAEKAWIGLRYGLF